MTKCMAYKNHLSDQKYITKPILPETLLRQKKKDRKRTKKTKRLVNTVNHSFPSPHTLDNLFSFTSLGGVIITIPSSSLHRSRQKGLDIIRWIVEIHQGNSKVIIAAGFIHLRQVDRMGRQTGR